MLAENLDDSILTGTREDWSHVERGRDLTVEETECLERDLLKNAGNLIYSRLLLLGFYEMRLNEHEGYEKAWHGHALWMIKHRPADWCSGQLRLRANSTDSVSCRFGLRMGRKIS